MKEISKTGFTLIEILLVVAIMGLLSSIIFVSLTQARIKARDAKRKADIKSLITAIHLYHSVNNQYPSGGALGTPNSETDVQNLSSFLVPNFLPKIPDDPNPVSSNYKYVWGNASAQAQEFGVLVPFSNDGGIDCKWITNGGNDNWFKQGSVKVVNCNY
jgi:prepilin-type N-terminal cleavage/methylation domain-containing protein